MSRKKTKTKKKNKIEQQCFPNCPYFPDMNCEDYRVDKNGLKHREPPKVFRCCFDNHPINWTTPCPIKALGGNNQISTIEIPKEFFTEFELERRKANKKNKSE